MDHVLVEVDGMIQRLTYPVDWNFQYNEPWDLWIGYYSPMIPEEVPDVLGWCEDTFGLRSFHIDSVIRWGYSGGDIWFRNREDVDWFLLRWS